MFDPKSSQAKLSPSATAIKEGSTLTTTVSTNNVTPGTTLYWSLTGNGINAKDLTKGGLSGSGTVSKFGTFSFSHLFAEDFTTEGDEKLIISLFADKSFKSPVAQTTVAIVDSSTAVAATPSYALNTSANAFKEGSTLTTTVETKNVSEGTTLYWSLSGEGINANDITKGGLSGSGIVSKFGTFSFSHLFAEDFSSEGDEKLIISLFTDKTFQKPVAQTAVEIVDNSTTTVATPAYALDTSANTFKEGGTLTTTVETKNVLAGTTLYWSLSGQGIDAKDITKGGLSGSGTVSKFGTFSFSHLFAEDFTSEGDEKLIISLFTDKTFQKPVAQTAVEIVDSSTTTVATQAYVLTPSANAIKEGNTLTTIVDTKNVAPGTTLYWSLSGEGINMLDLKTGDLLGVGTVSDNGSFSFSHEFAEDSTTEGDEKLIISLFTDKALEEPVAQTAVALQDHFNKPIGIKTDLSVEDHVIPARFSGEKIPAGTLIDFSSQGKSTTINFNNSDSGGYFEYQNKAYQGEELRNISMKELGQVSYVPKAPAGEFDALSKQNNPGISDRISITLNTEQGTSRAVEAEWVTQGNWKPEIAGLRQEFRANEGAEAGIPITDILDIYDLDGDTISEIKIRDLSSDDNSGYFVYKKTKYQGITLPTLSENDLSQVTYHPGPGGTTNKIEVSAIDSLNGTSRTFITELVTKAIPKTFLSNIKQKFTPADLNRSIPLTNLINISTTEATDTNTYNLNLNAKGGGASALGYFSLNNQRLSPEQLTGLSEATVRDIRFTPTNSKTNSTFTLEATDLNGKTTTSTTSWKSKKDKKPTVNVSPVQLGADRANTAIDFSNLISAEDDSGSIASYTLESVAGAGSFEFQGKTYSNQALTVAAEDLPLVQYFAPDSGEEDRIQISASDGEQESNPVFMNFGVLAGPQLNIGTLSQTFTLGFNEEWNIGDILGVRNQRTYSKFFGMDKTINNINWNRSISVAGVKFKTGNTRMKAGLQLDAGYGLGSVALQGGLRATATLDENGITFEGTSSDPTLDLELPYAYMNLDAVGKFKFSPSLKLWYDLWFTDGQTGNLLSFLNTDVDVRRSIVDMDTRDVTGNNYSKSFNLGAFSATATLPRFGRVSELNSVPRAIRNSRGWARGFGDGVAYGVQGSQKLLDLNLSLGQVASYFGLPLSISKSIWGGDLRVTGTLADASIGIDAELDYAAKVAVKPNVYATIEGSNPNRKYDILGDSDSIDPSRFRDTNNDGRITVTIEADPIISANASVSIEGGLNASAEVLSASARLRKWGYRKTWNVGPLWDWGPRTLYSDTVDLIDMTKTYTLSDLDPNLQDSLSVTLNLPVV